MSLILVIEDEPSIAENITYALSTEGYQSLTCATGEEGLQLLGGHPVALVVLDVGLPDISGFELAKSIHAAFDVPIIFVTARSSEIDRVLGLELGADDYITKPFSPRELTARVRAVLRRVHATSGSRVAETSHPQSEFTIDESKHVITYRGERLDLPRYEFRLLRVLVRRPGRVYSRDELMSLVWEVPEMSLERTVDTHIKTIRRKLKAVSPEHDPIKTHRGIGYSLREIGEE